MWISTQSTFAFQADLNNDGKIDWDEFVNMMMPDSGDDVDYASAANKHDHTSK